ncbi:alpha/beta fold hydrolase [bacterium]|nr:alpha/beta fold hydrolase [bacterium]
MTTPRSRKKHPAGCLLIHGFTGSPNELLDLGHFLSKKKLTVSIPTLPGHGTHSGDLFNYTWKDWFSCVKEQYHLLWEKCEEVFVCGLSMGGALALHLAAHRPMNGVVALAAAVKPPGWQEYSVRILKYAMRFRTKRGGEDVKDVASKEKLASYRRFPLYAVDQLFRLAAHVRDDLSEVHQPILIIHSKNDHTIPITSSELVFNSVSSADKRKVDLEESYHVITVDVEKERVWNEVWEFIHGHSKHLAESHETRPRRRPDAKPADAS